MTYRHNFDLGEYRLYKDNGDGSALFYQSEDQINNLEHPEMIRREFRLRKYYWAHMRVY